MDFFQNIRRSREVLGFLFIYLSLLPTSPAFPWDRPFNNMANWGATGLLEIPTARVLEDGEIRVGYANADPFIWYVVGMGILPGLEASASWTEISNIPSGFDTQFGSNRDRSFDFKYQILPESRRFPALAVGLHDTYGTQLFEAQYVVLNRQIFPFDFTFGLGTKRFRGPITLPFFDNVGLFGGIEWALNERMTLLAEYNPIDYEEDSPSVRGVDNNPSLRLNVGLRIKVLPGVNLGVSYQRAEQLSFMFQLQERLGKPIVTKRPDPPLWVSVDRTSLGQRDRKEIVEKIHEAIEDAGFRDVSVCSDGTDLVAEFENDKYLSSQKAAGRVLRILLFHCPPETQRLTAVLKRRRMPLLEVSVSPEHFEKYLFGKIPEEAFYRLMSVKTRTAGQDEERGQVVRTQEDKKPIWTFGIKPDFEAYLNDPENEFQFRVGIQPHLATELWKGGAGYARFNIPFYSDISSALEPLPDAVRSDIWLYLDRDYTFLNLLFDQAVRLRDKTFGRLTLGYLEMMYAGVTGEILSFLREGMVAVGLEASYLRKRKPGSNLDLLDFDTHTLLGNAYFKVPWFDLTLHAQYGRFMAGDVGWRFEVSREYDTGVVVGAWYSLTDTDDLSGYNKGYNDKGLFLTIPAGIFTSYETTTRYTYAISPWTRDVAANVYHWQPLFHLIDDLMPGPFESEPRKIKE